MKSTGRSAEAPPRSQNSRSGSPLGRLALALRPGFFALLLAGGGLVCCLTPLFNLLGYESSLVLALLASLGGLRQGVHVVGRAREHGLSLAGGGGARLAEQAQAQPLRTLLRLYLRALLSTEVLLLLPLLLLVGNGLRVKNCSYLGGLGFFAMMPMLSAAFAAAVGTVLGLTSLRRPFFVGVLLLLLSLGWSLWRFLATPAIYAHDPFFGYFPGALYDEEVQILASFGFARLLHALVALSLLLLAALLLDGDGLRLRLHKRRASLQSSRLPLLLATLLAVSATLGLWSQGGRLGIYTDGAALDRQLFAEQRTAHFILRYRPGGAIARDLPLLVREHELRYQQLHELLGVEPNWQPHGLSGLLSRLLGLHSSAAATGSGPQLVSYLFDSAEEKRRWMGASYTYIAKPWRREIYLHHEPWPHPVLHHELAHLFAGAAGDPLLRLALRYGLPQPGIIEGLAVAAEWHGSGSLSGHQSVLAMRRAGLEPPLREVLGLGFWRLPAGRAYTVAGSFCRYLLWRFGPTPLLAAYRRGGGPADFASSFGLPFSTLEADWQKFVDGQPLEAKSQEVARERLRRRAVFHKVCAHELALRRQEARAAAAHGDRATAVRLLATVCADDPDEPTNQLELLEALIAAEELGQAEQLGQKLLANPQRTPVIEARTAARLGDLLVLHGDSEGARRYYEQAAAGPDREGTGRMATVKLTALSSPQAGPLLLRFLVGDPPPATGAKPLRPAERGDAVAVYALLQAVAAEPALGLTHYLLGRLLYDRGGYSEAERELKLSQELGLPDGRFDFQALLLRGQAALLRDQAAEAAALFAQLAELVPSSEQGKLLDVNDLRERARRWPSL